MSSEAFVGRNNRGIGGLAGTTVVGTEVIDGNSVGGWGQLSYTVDRVSLNVGFGADESDGISNQTWYANGIYTKRRLPINFALEINCIETSYSTEPVAENVTVYFAARYNFSLGLR